MIATGRRDSSWRPVFLRRGIQTGNVSLVPVGDPRPAILFRIAFRIAPTATGRQNQPIPAAARPIGDGPSRGNCRSANRSSPNDSSGPPVASGMNFSLSIRVQRQQPRTKRLNAILYWAGCSTAGLTCAVAGRSPRFSRGAFCRKWNNGPGNRPSNTTATADRIAAK